MTYIPKDPNSYIGNQVIINSDRLLFNAKTDSILLYSDKAIGFSTRGNFHFDTDNSEESKSKFIVNSPNIYLGLEFDNSLPAPKAMYTLLKPHNGIPTPNSTAPANAASLFTSPITSLKL